VAQERGTSESGPRAREIAVRSRRDEISEVSSAWQSSPPTVSNMRYIFPLFFPSVREKELEINDSRAGQAEKERYGGKGKRTEPIKAGQVSRRLLLVFPFRLLLLNLIIILIFRSASEN